MTTDEAVDRFSAAYDDELSADDRQAFEAALNESPALRAEYDEFCRLLQETNRLGFDEEDAPNLLPAIQDKLNARSKGRYYRDRFARQSGSAAWISMTVAGAMFALVILAWVLMSYVEVHDSKTAQPDEHASDVPTR